MHPTLMEQTRLMEQTGILMHPAFLMQNGRLIQKSRSNGRIDAKPLRPIYWAGIIFLNANSDLLCKAGSECSWVKSRGM